MIVGHEAESRKNRNAVRWAAAAAFSLLLIPWSGNKADRSVPPVNAGLVDEFRAVDRDFSRALTLYGKGRYGDAVLATESILIRQPSNIAALRLQGSAYLRLNDAVSARKAMERIPMVEGSANFVGGRS